MRVAELFKRLLGIEGARVLDLDLIERGRRPELVVRLALKGRRLPRCGRCQAPARTVHDHRVRRWRHRDLGRARVVLECRLARVSCPACGVTEQAVAWARPGARLSRALEDTCAWLARQAPQSVVAELCGVDWETVGRIGRRVVAETRAGTDGLEGLRRIGVDEVSYRRGHRYLTVVTCQERGRVVWVGAGDPAKAFARFFTELGKERAARLEAISLDLAPRFVGLARRRARNAALCADPFHLVAKGQFALDRLRAAHWQALRGSDPARARWVKDTRFALRRGPARRSEADRDLIGQLAETNQELYRALLWCDQLRATIAGVDPEAARAELESLIAAAPSLGHRRFTMLAGTLSRHIELILNTIRHRLSNGRIEAMNSTVRLISHRARGFRKVENLIGLVHLICGPIKVALPT